MSEHAAYNKATVLKFLRTDFPHCFSNEGKKGKIKRNIILESKDLEKPQPMIW
jgi:sRNA-binding protein